MIALLDYGAGNLASVRKALAALEVPVFTPRRPEELALAAGIIVPGVGNFAATGALDGQWRESIQAALAKGRALFGICLGMQWLFEGSDESPDTPGLGIFRGTCRRLGEMGECCTSARSGERVLKVPHVGWNSLDVPEGPEIFRGVISGTQMYFTHSYAAPVVAQSAAVTTYGVPFSAAVEQGRISGVQFHPEKSGAAGLRVLANWLDAVQADHRLPRRA